jgi:protease-4
MREKIAGLFWPITAPITFIQNHFKASLLIVILLSFMSSDTGEVTPYNNLHKIVLSGPIFDSEKFLEELEKAQSDNVKGLLVVVNSPGGLVPPSIEMMLAIKEYAQSRPVVVYASGLLASGSYYASIGASEIIANPGSMVGSIGVIFQTMNVESLMQKVGVTPRVVKSGEYKEIGAMYRAWEPHEQQALEKLSTDTYNMFVKDVSTARGLKIEDAPNFANGRVFLAQEAKTLGLIDEVGNIRFARERIMELAEVKNPIWNKKSDFDKLMERLNAEVSMSLSTVIQNLLTSLALYR